MSFNKNDLDVAYSDGRRLFYRPLPIDTFKFRKGFEEDKDLTEEEKEQILDYLADRMPRGSLDYWAVKLQIDTQEFNSDFFINPTYPRKFRGSYYPVILKTFGGLMSVLLQQ